MCNYFFKPLYEQHKVEVHGNKETDRFHAVCMDCNVYLLVTGTEAEALEVKANHFAIFESLEKLEPFSKFMPRCACYSEYLNSLDEAELDAEIDLAYEIEEFIQVRMNGGIEEEVVAASMLEVELFLDPTLLKEAKGIYQLELLKLL